MRPSSILSFFTLISIPLILEDLDNQSSGSKVSEKLSLSVIQLIVSTTLLASPVLSFSQTCFLLSVFIGHFCENQKSPMKKVRWNHTGWVSLLQETLYCFQRSQVTVAKGAVSPISSLFKIMTQLCLVINHPLLLGVWGTVTALHELWEKALNMLLGTVFNSKMWNKIWLEFNSL